MKFTSKREMERLKVNAGISEQYMKKIRGSFVLHNLLLENLRKENMNVSELSLFFLIFGSFRVNKRIDMIYAFHGVMFLL